MKMLDFRSKEVKSKVLSRYIEGVARFTADFIKFHSLSIRMKKAQNLIKSLGLLIDFDCLKYIFHIVRRKNIFKNNLGFHPTNFARQSQILSSAKSQRNFKECA